jgi:hypothetical protein
MVAALERTSAAMPPSLPVEQVNVEALLMQAVQSGVPVESLERLMAMRRELREEYARQAFFTALAGFQSECPVIAKTSEVKDRGGQSVRYRFASLDRIVETIRPHLQRHELSFTFRTAFDLDNNHLVAACEVHHALGHSETSEFRVPIAKDSFMNGAQHFGSASSYARRYALLGALGIVTGDEDDDAQGSEPESRPAAQAQRSAPPPRPDASQPPPYRKEVAPQQESPGVERERLLEHVVALGIELGYDTRLQTNARSKAATKTNEEIVKAVIPSLNRLIAQKRAELSQKITAELAGMGLDEEQMAGYVAENGGQGKKLDDCTLAEMRQVAESLEIQ